MKQAETLVISGNFQLPLHLTFKKEEKISPFGDTSFSCNSDPCMHHELKKVKLFQPEGRKFYGKISMSN